jgi:hypothetical protein
MNDLPPITLGSFRFFSEVCGDIRKSRFTTGINDIGGKFANRLSSMYRGV